MTSDQQRLQALVAKVRAIIDNRSIEITAEVSPFEPKWLINVFQGTRGLKFEARPGVPHEEIVEAIELWAAKLRR